MDPALIRCPAVDCSPGVCSSQAPVLVARGPRGAASLLGTGVEVWQVVRELERDGLERRVARELGLTEHQVRVAREYAERHPSRVERDRERG
jgi:uncharacterized protein (DUF433 family)